MTDLTWPETQPTLDATADGDRLTLRPWRATDADIDAVVTACQDPETIRWTMVPHPYERHHAEGYVGPVSRDAWASRSAVNWAAVDAADTVLGSISLVRINLQTSVAEVGYWVSPRARRRGVARRAAAAVTEWALREVGFPRVELLAAVGNAGSRRVAELAGFTQEGVLRSAGLGRGERLDMVIFGRLPDDAVPSPRRPATT